MTASTMGVCAQPLRRADPWTADGAEVDPGRPAAETREALNAFVVLGSPVSIVDFASAFGQLKSWIDRRLNAYICVADVRSIMLARSDLDHRTALDQAGMVLPDGVPLVWTGRLRGVSEIRRVCGADFMLEACNHPAAAGWRHFFLGGGEGVAQALAANLSAAAPGMVVCGLATPSFGPWTEAEEAELMRQLKDSRPDVVWVGLGCPKQERWMLSHMAQLDGAVMVGVGAAFDFHAGRVRRAPRWMQTGGLEWLHRLCSEPRRLWRRYLLLAPAFAVLATWETLRIRVARRQVRRRPTAAQA